MLSDKDETEKHLHQVVRFFLFNAERIIHALGTRQQFFHTFGDLNVPKYSTW